jgi:hypothetical protein
MSFSEEYKKALSDCLKAFDMKSSDIRLLFSKDLFGGRVVSIDDFKFDNCVRIKGSVVVGRPSRPYNEEKRALVFHEVSHLLFFSYIGFREGKNSYKGILNHIAENPELVPWSEVIAEFLTAKYGRLEKYVLSRKFEEWKWWKRKAAFEYAMKTVAYLLDRFEKAGNHYITLLSCLDFCLESEWSRKRMKKTYMLLKGSD